MSLEYKLRNEPSDLGASVTTGTSGVYIPPNATPEQRREKIRILVESIDTRWR